MIKKCQSCRCRWGGEVTHKADWVKKAYVQYTEKRQTPNNLSDEYGLSGRTIQKRFDGYAAVTGEIRVPWHAVNLVIDATFFSRRDGVLIARAEGRNLLWREIETESILTYELFLRNLTAYLPTRPKLAAGQELRRIAAHSNANGSSWIATRSGSMA